MVEGEYAIKISWKDGVLEVTGPDKDWVGAKIEQLGDAVSAHAGEVEGPPAALRRRGAARAGAPKDVSAERGDSPTPARRNRGGGGKPAMSEELQGKLTREVRDELEQYISARRKQWDGSQSAQAAIIATFLQDTLGVEGVDTHDLYTVYRVMGERSPGNVRSQLTNARQRARYFGGLIDGKMVLSTAGENFARYDSLGAPNDEPQTAADA